MVIWRFSSPYCTQHQCAYLPRCVTVSVNVKWPGQIYMVLSICEWTFRAIMNNAAMNIHVQVSVWTFVLNSLDIYLGVEFLDHMVTPWTAKLFSKSAVPPAFSLAIISYSTSSPIFVIALWRFFPSGVGL